MTRAKVLAISAAVSLSLGVLWAMGCSSSATPSGSGGQTTTTHPTTTTTTTSSTTTSTTITNIPPPPVIGPQIDRIGRPAISTALIHAFDADTTAAGQAKDAYNQDGDPSHWAPTFADEIARNLAVLDAIDGTCGNQTGYTAPASASSYAKLAGLLAGDAIWLDTGGAVCTTYLAVEANALGIVPSGDCGGRFLAYDVIDVTYSAAAHASFSGLGDGVKGNDVSYLTTFPYLAPPH